MTTVVLRPDGTDSTVGTITITGAASIHAAINDSSDASYINGAGGATYAYVSMQTTAMPAGAVTSTIALTIRDSSTTNCRLYVDGASIISMNGSPTITTLTSANTAVSLSQTQLDGLQGFVNTSGVGKFVYDLYATLVYATQPVTAVTLPTGVNAISQPTVTWSHTAGSDGGSQARYQVRIFSAAEYGVSGFAAGSSPCTWDSGDTASSVTSTTSGALANTTTYRAYVRTAQTINGAAHWAEWAYSAFTTSFTTPDITSVTVTGDNTYARHRITVTRNTGTPNWTAFDVERSDDAGVTWVAVRGATIATPPGDVWIGYDYEGTNGTAAIFRARARTATVIGPYATSSAATWTSTEHWVKDLRSPGNNVTVEISDLPQRSWAVEQGVHRPVGRADPVVVSDTRQLHTASLTFEAYTSATGDALRALLSSGTVLLQIAALGYGNIYLVAGTIADRQGFEHIGSTWRFIDAAYTEVATPADDGVDTTGLTWQDIASTYATWQALLDTGKVWGDLV